VLSTPPAFVLSQDQTLRGKFISSGIRINAGFSGRLLFSFQGTGAPCANYYKKNAAELKPGGKRFNPFRYFLSSSLAPNLSYIDANIKSFGNFQGPK
jgi:hypothetical protein